MDLTKFIRDIPDFPKEGIIFKDITPLLKNPAALEESIAQMAEPYWDKGITDVIGIESRGFIFGCALAIELGVGFIPIRKPGKLNMHSNVIICDDLLATGGTAEAAVKLIKSQEANIAGISFLIELEFLNGREKIKEIPIYSLIKY